MGLKSVRIPQNPSEPGYVAAVNRAVKALEKDLLSIFDQIEEITPGVMMEVLEPVKTKAEYYCPKDTGALVESSYLEVTQYRGKPRVELGFARGGEPRYAVYVHENLEYYHKAPTQAKFLERAVNEEMNEIFMHIGELYGRFMSG
jgi:hypothetical protein